MNFELPLDILAVGAHPDDIELGVGGTLLLAAMASQRTGLLHLTRGELGTRGSSEIRTAEARDAADALGASHLEFLDLGDGSLTVDEAAKVAVIGVLRRLRPRLVLAPFWEDLHPDHKAAGELMRQCAFLSGIGRRNPELGAAWRPERTLYYMSHTAFEPDLVVDISAVFTQKRDAAMCYRSQFHDPTSSEPRTYISGEKFWPWWEGRHLAAGHLIGVAYGEALCADGPVPTREPWQLFHRFGRYRND